MLFILFSTCEALKALATEDNMTNNPERNNTGLK